MPHKKSAFQRFCDEFFDFIMREFPPTATWLGIHRYDTKLPDMSAARVEERNRQVEKFAARLKRFNPRRLKGDGPVDYALTDGMLKCWIEGEKRFPDHKRMPGLYLNTGLYSLYVLIEREFAPKAKRAKSVLARLKKFPRLLRQGMTNLERPPKEFTQAAILAAKGAIGFLKGPLSQFIQPIRGKLGSDLAQARDKAVAAVERYAKFLEEDLLPRSRGKFAVGKQFFNLLLKYEHHVDVDADELLRFGRKHLRSVKRELEQTAKRIAPRRKWTTIVDELKQEHPSNRELVNYYAKEMARARDFVRKRRLATFPPHERLKVIPTPDFARPLIPYAAYVSPAPFEPDKQGIFWVTTVPKGTPKKRAEEQLEGHSKYGIVVTALHEAYPGHHFQLSVAAHLPHRLRHLVHTSVFAEGWALYCEQMMWEQGFYHDLRSRLLQLKDALWRACRVVVDVNLHTGKMSFDEAVDFMVKEAKLERVNAEAEVRRYCQQPTQPMSYLLGKVQILELLKDYRKLKGKDFRLRKFHDQLLAHGTIPVKYVRELMGVG